MDTDGKSQRTAGTKSTVKSASLLRAQGSTPGGEQRSQSHWAFKEIQVRASSASAAKTQASASLEAGVGGQTTQHDTLELLPAVLVCQQMSPWFVTNQLENLYALCTAQLIVPASQASWRRSTENFTCKFLQTVKCHTNEGVLPLLNKSHSKKGDMVYI